MVIHHVVAQILAGQDLQFDEAFRLATSCRPAELYRAADELRETLHQKNLDLCAIVNARSGRCSEDCRFCAQSAHYEVGVASYEVVDPAQAVELARDSEQHGVGRFSLVTAGRSVAENHLTEFRDIYRQLREQTDLALCASMGLLTPEKAQQLQEMGVSRYHCNLETSRSYFATVCTTHTWEEKVATLKIAREAGLELCSGGIIGMGESLAQRLEMALELRELGVLSIPLNILTPIKDTPFGHLQPLGIDEVLTAIAMFRLINPQAVIRMAGGRNLLGSGQHRCFTAGANGAIVGNYLTTVGNTLGEDLAMFRTLGFEIRRRQGQIAA